MELDAWNIGVALRRAGRMRDAREFAREYNDALYKDRKGASWGFDPNDKTDRNNAQRVLDKWNKRL